MSEIPGHAALDKIVGNWKTEGKILEAGAPSKSMSGSDIYEWLPGGHFVIHWIDVMMDQQHVQAVEIIGPYDSESQTYPLRAFGSDGIYSKMTGQFSEDGAWLAHEEQTRVRLTVNDERSEMKATWERRNNDEWVPWMNMSFARMDK